MNQKLQRTGSGEAFTLIELLVVISIIGLLAALTMGVTGLASRTMKSKRMEGEIERLISDLENYHSAVGNYPPDNPGFPSKSQLYYELTGATFQNGTFRTLDREVTITAQDYAAVFHADGINNSGRTEQEVKFKAAFKPSQIREISDNPEVEVLVAPLPSLDGTTPAIWNYVSTNPTNNPSSFDLWADVKIGKQIYRFSNWSKGGHPLQ